MTITTGDRLPDATFLVLDDDGGPTTADLGNLISGKRVAILALPGAFTRTCTAAHLPSFIRTKDQFAAKGIDTVICIAVNDPFVVDAWAKSTGADTAGIVMLADGDGSFTKAIGMNFDAPPVGFYGRSKRLSMLVDDGTVTVLNVDDNPGVCDSSAGETLLAQA